MHAAGYMVVLRHPHGDDERRPLRGWTRRGRRWLPTYWLEGELFALDVQAPGFAEDPIEPGRILSDQVVRDTLDFTRPVALMLVRHRASAGRRAGPGSYVVLSHATFDPLDEDTVARLNAVNTDSGPPFCPRRFDEVARFSGLHLLEPGIVSVADWRADDEPQPRPAPAEVAWYGAVGRKPAS
ncbi:S-adenosyl methyltransferase [Krasilnikovia cinnamomea]|uniref:S-adenosyl methyltransferase n=1 Tax=Krasilnikovia cinnamomea TaxID=349313 RepID=A0A4V2G7M9_9ACTN|nr:SAM-dependent methyltransferase [Krasilnikovia cinnamomea]RZU53256.1 S-adenosyl methyltransferase [Krasilnikovia cinnamomea]